MTEQTNNQGAKDYQELEFTVVLAYRPEENRGMEPRQFLNHMLVRLNADVPVLSVTYKEKTREFEEADPLANLPLRVVDSIDESDVPPPSPEAAAEEALLHAKAEEEKEAVEEQEESEKQLAGDAGESIETA